MKYEHSIEIRRPRAEVVALFEDPENLARWQDGFVSMATLAGEPGQVGSTARLEYKMGKRVVAMTETVVHRDLPDAMHFTYEAGKVWNRVDNYFLEAGADATVWRQVNEFRLAGPMKIVGALMPFAFKRQSLKYLRAFKKFAESR